MIKGVMFKKTFNIILILIIIALISGSIYFYTSAKTKVGVLNSGFTSVKDVLLAKGLSDSINSAISSLFSLIIIQIFTFVILNLSLIFLLWFVFDLYLIHQEKALIDPLTGVYNRRAIMIGLKKEIERAERFGEKLSVAILDIDYFKKYNDANGHKAGDNALIKVAKVIDKNVRKTDMFGRIGGEEFMIIFSETDLSEAMKICERIRASVERAVIPFEENLPGKALTISIGVAEFHHARTKHYNHDVFDQADKQLYLAKASGRNCVK